MEVFESLPPVSMLSSVATDRAYSCLGDRSLESLSRLAAVGSYETAAV